MDLGGTAVADGVNVRGEIRRADCAGVPAVAAGSEDVLVLVVPFREAGGGGTVAVKLRAWRPASIRCEFVGFSAGLAGVSAEPWRLVCGWDPVRFGVLL